MPSLGAFLDGLDYRVIGLSVGEDFVSYYSFHRFDTVPACNRQTNRQRNMPTMAVAQDYASYANSR